MPLLGVLIKQGIKLGTRIKVRKSPPANMQRRTLKKLLKTAQFTSFGKEYGFSEMLQARHPEKEFQRRIPVYNYNSIYEKWWYRCLKEEENVCWPGYIKYFALSSGTSDSASKHIPVTRDMVRALRKASIRHILTLANYNFPPSLFEKGILWLGGSTDLKKQGGYYEGDVSGISARRVPIWFRKYYKPGRKISKVKDWEKKLKEMTEQAHKWDISIITGVPSWVQLLMERVIEHYKVKTIHDVWPNLRVYVHGGVSFEPYKKNFEKLVAEPLTYIELYPASEGFIAFQTHPDAGCMKMILDNGIFYEFIPFDEQNFDDNGEPVENAPCLLIDEVEEGKDYAILLSTCAGAWRYLLGDVIRFTSKENYEICITGRTKHFLSLCGEHLSVDNMNKAIRHVSDEMNIDISEFTVSGLIVDGAAFHEWYIGTNAAVNPDELSKKIDQQLKVLNDDYEVERQSALKKVMVNVISPDLFYAYMRSQGREGGQNKFPRVMKEKQWKEWKEFLSRGT